MTRRVLLMLGGLGVSAVALVLVLQSVDLRETTRVLAQAQLLPIGAILGVVAVQVWLRAVRWSRVLPARPPVPASRLVAPMLIGYLGNAVLPARLGEAMRAVVAARRESPDLPTTFGSVVLERIVDVVTLAIVALVAAVLAGAPTWSVQALGVLVGIGLLIMVTLLVVGLTPIIGALDRMGLWRVPGVHAAAARFAATLGGPSRRRVIAAAALLSTGAWLLDAASFWLAGMAVGAELSYASAALIGGVAILGTAIPSAPGFVGTFEAAAAGMAMALGIPGSEALAMAIVAHVMTLIPLALGGVVSLLATGSTLMGVARTAEASRHG